MTTVMKTTTVLGQMFGELEQEIMSFFSRKATKEGLKDLARHIEDTTSSISQMLPAIKEYPHLGAMGFLGKMRFAEDSALVKKLDKEFSPEILEELLAAKVVSVRESAKSAWEEILEFDKTTACAVLALVYKAQKKKKINQFFK